VCSVTASRRDGRTVFARISVISQLSAHHDAGATCAGDNLRLLPLVEELAGGAVLMPRH
jgi:hypothetical protein